MTTKKKPGTNAEGKKAALPAPALDRERPDALAKVAVLPSANAALVMTSYGGSLGLRAAAISAGGTNWEPPVSVRMPDSSSVERQPGESVKALLDRAEQSYRQRVKAQPVLLVSLRYST